MTSESHRLVLGDRGCGYFLFGFWAKCDIDCVRKQRPLTSCVSWSKRESLSSDWYVVRMLTVYRYCCGKLKHRIDFKYKSITFSPKEKLIYFLLCC